MNGQALAMMQQLGSVNNRKHKDSEKHKSKTHKDGKPKKKKKERKLRKRRRKKKKKHHKKKKYVPPMKQTTLADNFVIMKDGKTYHKIKIKSSRKRRHQHLQNKSKNIPPSNLGPVAERVMQMSNKKAGNDLWNDLHVVKEVVKG